MTKVILSYKKKLNPHPDKKILLPLVYSFKKNKNNLFTFVKENISKVEGRKVND